MTRDGLIPTTNDCRYPNRATIVGRGVPAQYELTVDGELETTDDAGGDGAIATSSAVEGTIAAGVVRVRFSGELANVRLVDWNGVEAPGSENTPTVHVEYGVSR